MGALVKLHLTSGPLHVPFLQAGTPSLLMLSMVEHPDISSLASNTASLVSLLLAPHLMQHYHPTLSPPIMIFFFAFAFIGFFVFVFVFFFVNV